MSVVPFLLPPRLSRAFAGRPSAVQSDFDALLTRMRQRLYPETLPVLGSYWLKTICLQGHNRAWWKELDGKLRRALRDASLDAASRELLAAIQTWIRETVLGSDKLPHASIPHPEAFRANVTPERLASYTVRLLNEWLPAEAARLLVDEREPGGIPAMTLARALEGLLLRERLLPGTLEQLLEPALLSPRYAYPADVEILYDIVLALLGRTQAPPMPVMPAAILGTAEGALHTPQYKEAVALAAYRQQKGREEILVPISEAQAHEILNGDWVRLGSVLVTMDGRWWTSDTLQSGEQHVVVYRPGGRLEIDYSADHTRLRVPWQATQLSWKGEVHFAEPFEIFGREWHVERWETDGERTWLNLAFTRALSIPESPENPERRFRRSHPAFIDMAWASMDSALADSLAGKSCQPIEEMRRSDLIPLGRALYGLAIAAKRRQRRQETMDTQLRAIRYLEAELSLVYGRVPWRILPAAIQKALLKIPSGPDRIELLTQTFDELPAEVLRERSKEPQNTQATGAAPPSQAA